MRSAVTALSAKKLFALAAGLAGVSLVSFFIGVVCLVIGIRGSSQRDRGAAAVAHGSSAGEEAEPAAAPEPAAEESKSEGGLFSRLRRTAGRALSGGAGPAPAGFNDGHPVGLYLFTRYWIATSHLEKGVYYFTRDGRVYENLVSGFSEDELAAHQGRHGTAHAKGDNMVVKWADGKETDSSIERDEDGDGFGWDMALFAPVDAFTDSSALVGKWEGGQSLTFSGNYAATVSGLDLKADGTFSGQSVASFRTVSDGTASTVGGSGSTTGTWQLEGYKLTLTYGNGKVVTGITFPFDDEKTRRTYFQGTLYKKL